jgi:hypothetical protein
LLQVDPELRTRTRLSWLREAPEIPSARSLRKVLERLAYLCALELPTPDGRVHPNRLRQLASRCGQYAAQPLARFAAEQRHTLLAAYLPDLSASLTDQTLDMLDKILDELVRKGKKKQERYFQTNVRTIEVLIDRDAVQSGTASAGTPWQYFDLGHGLCTYSFFEQCPHRMACARCDFYVPKDSTKTQLLEARGNLKRMLAQIPLTDDERAAVEDGTVAMERLIARLKDVVTPAGPTPRELSQAESFIPLDQLDRHRRLELQ